MLLYIAYFVVLAALAVVWDYQPFPRLPALLLVILMLGFMAGLRGPFVARDYADYQHSFDAIYGYYSEIRGGRIFTFFEPGYVLLVTALRALAPLNYGAVCMLFFAFGSIILKTHAANRLSLNPFLAMLFYYSHYFFLHEMTQVRIGFASAIIFIGFIYYLRGEWLKYVGFVLLATLFHYSAILYLGIFVFNSKKLNTPIYISFLLLAVVMGFVKTNLFEVLNQVNPELVTGKLRGYEYVAKTAFRQQINTFNVVYLMNVAVILYMLLISPRKVLEQDRNLLLFIKLNILSLFLLSALNGVPAIAFRISELFGVTSMLLFAGVVYYLPFKKGNVWIMVLIAGLFTYINLFHNDLIGPYTMVRFK